MDRRWTVPAALGLLVLLYQRLVPPGPALGDGNVYEQARLFENVMAHVRDYYVDSLPESELYVRASDGLLAKLNDPYAALLRGKEWEKHVERTTGDYAGIGLLVDARNGWVTVVLANAGLAGGAGRASAPATYSSRWTASSAADWTLDQAVQAMRGKLGSTDRDRHPPRGDRRSRCRYQPRPGADPPARGAVWRAPRVTESAISA